MSNNEEGKIVEAVNITPLATDETGFEFFLDGSLGLVFLVIAIIAAQRYVSYQYRKSNCLHVYYWEGNWYSAIHLFFSSSPPTPFPSLIVSIVFRHVSRSQREEWHGVVAKGVGQRQQS